MFKRTSQIHLRRSSPIMLASLVSAVLAGPIAAHAADTHADDKKPMAADAMDHSQMMQMQHMPGMSMTGDADFDFATNMRKHHLMGIEMAEAELKKGKSPEMIKQAKDIIAAQKKEVALFDRWLESHAKDAGAMPKAK